MSVTEDSMFGKGEASKSFAQRIEATLKSERDVGDFYEVVPILNMIDKPWSLWRLDKSGVRYYYNPANEEFYPSTTSITWNTMKEGKYLTEWKLKMAVENNDPNAPDNYMNERSAYGTLMHILYTECIMAGAIHSDQVEGAVYLYQQIFNLGHINVRNWIPELKSDIASFFEWFKIHEITPLALEIPIYYPVFLTIRDNPILIGWVAGTIDMVMEMTVRSDGGDVTPRTPMNNRERVLAICDYKSGKKGFYDSHKIQLNSYMDGWNWIQNKFLGGDYNIERCYNFAPSGGRSAEAKFKFENQAGDKVYRKYPHLLAEFMIDGRHHVPDIRFVEGDFKLGESGSSHVHVVSAKDFINKKFNKEEG